MVWARLRAGLHERRLSLHLQLLFALESSLFSILTPILPHYVRTLGASKAEIGVLTGAYSAGLIPAALLGGWLAGRGQVRRTTSAGVVLFAAGVASFGFAGDIVSLDVLRAIEGFGGGLIWAGALTWLIATAPSTRRGRVIGTVFSAAITGTLIGPAIGTVALSLGTGVTFGVLGIIALALAVGVLRHGEPELAARTSGLSLGPLLRNRALLLGLWLLLLEAAAFAVVYALAPLRLARFGASSSAIAGSFVAGSAVRVLLAPQIGRFSDRRGALLPTMLGLALAAMALCALPLPTTAGALTVTTALVMAGPLTVFAIPASSLFTVAAERAGIGLAVAAMLFSLTFALGQTITAPAGASLAQATSDAIPYFALTVLLLATMGLTMLYRRDPLVAEAAAPLDQAPDLRAGETAFEAGRAHLPVKTMRASDQRHATQDERV
jgi:MFS family permease